jgi:hypothetical protein
MVSHFVTVKKLIDISPHIFVLLTLVYQQSSKRITKYQESNNKEQKGLAPMVQADSSRRISYSAGLLL